jgi:hypothetical protein
MLGKSAGGAATGLALALLCSCAHNVSQDAATGPDGKEKGAKPINLDNNEGKATGIVTYPGGDRIDWKEVDLPDKTVGTLDFKLQWTPPRPGLQLAFDVFDEWGTPIVTSKGKRRSRGRTRTATIPDAKGKYFVRIYAPKRSDAGKYKITVDFAPATASNTDWTKEEVADPPKLPGLPEVVEPCDDTNFDPKNKACRDFCPAANPPPGWPGCKGKCTMDPPDPTNPACWDKVCPNPPTKKARACKLSDFKPCDPTAPDPDNPRCDIKAAPVVGRIIGNQVQGSEVLITIAAGSEKGVDMTWTGHVLRGSSDTPLDGGDVKIIRVDKRATLGKVHLNIDQLEANGQVKLSPP